MIEISTPIDINFTIDGKITIVNLSEKIHNQNFTTKIKS